MPHRINNHTVIFDALQIAMLTAPHTRRMVMMVEVPSDGALQVVIGYSSGLTAQGLRLQARPVNGGLQHFHSREAVTVDFQLDRSALGRVEVYGGWSGLEKA